MSRKILIVLAVFVMLGLIATPGYAQTSCEDTYTVQADDWLSKLADRFFGNILAYPAILDATNTAAANDDTYSTIQNPDEIEVGQVLCVPSSDAAEAFLNPTTEGGKVLVEFWTTDNDPGRPEVYEAVAARYMEQNPNVDLRIVPIHEMP